MPDLMDVKMEADIPWITFYDETSWIGFTGIQLSYDNAGLETAPRLFKSLFLYCRRPMDLLGLGTVAPLSCIQYATGDASHEREFFSEKWAYLVYETEKGGKPYGRIQKNKLAD